MGWTHQPRRHRALRRVGHRARRRHLQHELHPLRLRRIPVPLAQSHGTRKLLRPLLRLRRRQHPRPPSRTLRHAHPAKHSQRRLRRSRSAARPLPHQILLRRPRHLEHPALPRRHPSKTRGLRLQPTSPRPVTRWKNHPKIPQWQFLRRPHVLRHHLPHALR